MYDIYVNFKKEMCNVELKQLASIIQGNIPTRIEVSEGVSIETITINGIKAFLILQEKAQEITAY